MLDWRGSHRLGSAAPLYLAIYSPRQVDALTSKRPSNDPS